jgi:hypothetical protein
MELTMRKPDQVHCQSFAAMKPFFRQARESQYRSCNICAVFLEEPDCEASRHWCSDRSEDDFHCRYGINYLVPKLIRCAINGEHQVLRHLYPAFPFARAFAHAVIPESAGAFAIAGDFTSAAALSSGKALIFCHTTLFILISSPSVLLHGLVLPGIHDLQVLNHLAGHPR